MLNTRTWELQKYEFNKNKSHATFIIISQQIQCGKLL